MKDDVVTLAPGDYANIPTRCACSTFLQVFTFWWYGDGSRSGVQTFDGPASLGARPTLWENAIAALDGVEMSILIGV